MKKTFWSLAALMLMAAPVMTSCSNDLDEVAPVEEAKSNVVTITIAPPAAETRVGMTGLGITGWALNDKVTLYRTNQMGSDMNIMGDGVTFKCIDAENGTFSAPFEGVIDEYNLAVFGCTAKAEGGIVFTPTTWSSTELKDVVMMAAFKAGSSYTMKIINNVLKIENTTSLDVEVGWYGWDYYNEVNTFYNLATQYVFENDGPGPFDGSWKWGGKCVNWANCSWGETAHFTLEASAVNYVSFPMVGVIYGGDDEKLGLYKSDATAVLSMKGLGGKDNVSGKLYDAGSF